MLLAALLMDNLNKFSVPWLRVFVPQRRYDPVMLKGNYFKVKANMTLNEREHFFLAKEWRETEIAVFVLGPDL